MKFPITRESLQAYDPVKEAAEKKEEQIQLGLNQMLIQLRNDFEEGMKVYAEKEAGWRRHQDMDLHHQNRYCKPILPEKMFIWRNLQQKSQPVYSVPGFGISTIFPITRFLEMVKGDFVGCAIIVDPLKTYLIIDWS